MRKIVYLLMFIFGIGLASAHEESECGMMSGFYGGYGTGMMIFMWIFLLAVIALIIAIIYWIIRNADRR